MPTKLGRFGFTCLSIAATLVLVCPTSARPGRSFYVQHNLVSDLASLAPRTDPHLVNPWGVAAGDETALWVNDNGTGVATIYSGNGLPSSLVVTIPGTPGSPDPSEPTGIVYSEAGDDDPTAFAVTGAGGSGPSIFIFDTQNGTISGWNPRADRTHAILEVDNSGGESQYTGLAIIDDHIYAANFGTGLVEIYDKDWQAAGTFTGPNLPADYAPFGIQAIGDELFVAFAEKAGDDEVQGDGLGIVDVFDEDGVFVRELAAHGPLNAPWGLTRAPGNFGPFSNAVLVGNLGDGRINAFDAETGAFLGPLTDNHGNPIENDGLWGIIFGNGGASGKSNVLTFVAGIDDETHGLLGRISSSSNTRP